MSIALLRELGRVGYGAVTLGHGDLTIAAMVGATAGPEVIVALASGVVLSGVVALTVLLRGRSRTAQIAYGPGLCLGGLLCLVFR
jgi:prepilin signal peptidase PulO-like enzyme (type II secretory pathway)